MDFYLILKTAQCGISWRILSENMNYEKSATEIVYKIYTYPHTQAQIVRVKA